MRNELFALLASARETYLRDVIDNGKLYRRFVDDFINSHRYIDCDNVVCRNCHEMIIHIIRSILHDYQDYVQKMFTAGSFSLEDCMEMKRMYDTSEINSPACDADPMATATSLSFECNFSKEQMTGIVACANTYHLFCVPTIRMEDMETLFACKEGFRIRVNNIRHVTVLFDALLERSYIQAHWQSVLERGKFLVSKQTHRDSFKPVNCPVCGKNPSYICRLCYQDNDRPTSITVYSYDLKRSSMVTSLWTILLCLPSTTPYVVTNVITNVQSHPFAEFHLVVISDGIAVSAELHFAQMDDTVCTLDNHVNLEAGHVFVGICLASP